MDSIRLKSDDCVMDTDDKEKMAALRKWAKRVLSDSAERPGADEAINKRRSPRKAVDAEVSLIPIDTRTLRPAPDKKCRAVIKDLSETGIGLVAHGNVEGELFFATIQGLSKLYLVRACRVRKIMGNITELGMQILDHYGSFDELRGG